MKCRVMLWKAIGETPLMAIERFRKAHPAYEHIPAAYAGRLDPMAEGKLLILLGDECKRQARYHTLDKEYEVEVLLDVGSDTGDVLGITTYAGKETRVDQRMLATFLKKERGSHERPYPKYSSKTVGGKPLFLHALEGTIESIEIPMHTEHIYSIRVLGMKRSSSTELKAHVDSFLEKVPQSEEPSKALGADFRIEKVRAGWEQLFSSVGTREFTVIRLRVVCGGGTYMRSLAERIGTILGTRALACSIRRTKIGRKHLFGVCSHYAFAYS
jgi:tRNA U55 pseudouridine synthase TruB